MSALSIQPTFPIFTETDGLPLENGYIWIGAANLDPQGNPINVYWDAALTIAAPQPVRTLNGYPSRNGTPGRLYVNSDYSIRVQNSKGSLVYSAPTATERYSGAVISSVTAGQVTYDESVSYPVATVGYSLNKREVVITDAPYNASTTAIPGDNFIAIQAAINACPQGGTVLIPNGTFDINDELIIDKAITIRGLGPGKWEDSLGGSIIRQTNVGKNAFTLRASLAQWAFGLYGLNNVNFQDLAITGPSIASFAARGIGCDTTVNGGDYHIRECTFTNLEVRHFNTGIEFIGICYLNDFYGGVISRCGTGFGLYKGLASDRGSQTRFFGTTFDLHADACIKWNTDTYSGDLSLFGCTLAESAYGLIANEEATLMISGCSFEALVKAGSLGAGIYIQIKELNASSDATKTIIGNKMLGSDCDIWIECINASTQPGNFNWPMLIDSNQMISTEALRITMPVGSRPMSSSQFVLGASNSGLNSGRIAPSQISANFAGQFPFNRVIRRRYTIGVGSPTGLDQLPPGMIVTKARLYLTANSTVFTQLFYGDATVNNRYVNIDAQTQALNTWVDWTPTIPDYVVSNALDGELICGGTAGFQGFVGVAEIEGYVDYKLN